MEWGRCDHLHCRRCLESGRVRSRHRARYRSDAVNSPKVTHESNYLAGFRPFDSRGQPRCPVTAESRWALAPVAVIRLGMRIHQYTIIWNGSCV